jgi:hypothetical protein
MSTQDKIVHKLLIEFRLGSEPIREQPLEITLKFTNISDRVFPGGKVVMFGLIFADGHTIVDTNESELPNIPPIEPNNSFETAHTFFPLLEGFTWIRAKVHANDNQEINYYQNPNYTTGNEWRNGIYVVNKENKTIISLLSEIAKSLRK